MAKRKKKSTTPVEHFYRSETGARITDLQMITELLARYRAEFLNLQCQRPWEHELIREFYQAQFSDAGRLIRTYGGRVVLSVLEQNKWICNPKYSSGGRPLLIGKFTSLLEEAKIKNQSKINYTHKSFPTNVAKEQPRKQREF